MYLKNFWKETIVAGGLAFGGTLLLLGFRLISDSTRRSYYMHTSQYITLGSRLVGLGAIVCVISFAVGFMFAFGVGPAREKLGATVEERMAMMSDGTPLFDEIPDGVKVRHYLRLRMPDGEVIEANCSQDAYYRCTEGTVINAKLSGQRLVSFIKTGKAY